MDGNTASWARRQPEPVKKSTLVSIAITFIVGIGAVIWLCYVSFKDPVMSFETTNAPGPLPTAPPTLPPVVVARPVVAPTQSQDVFPRIIPTIPRPIIVTPAPNGQHEPPAPDG
jgi:hypothetical protein